MLTQIASRHQKVLIYTVAVLIVWAQRTHGQSYLLTLSQSQQRNFFGEENTRDKFLKSPLTKQHFNHTDTENIFLSSNEVINEDSNTTIIVIKSTVHEKANELSQSTMDIITVVWYVATFLALAAFFMLMACSDRRCNEAQSNGGSANDTSNGELPISPPTPSPSYSEFAPPSYETVIKMQHANKTSIFVIPFDTTAAAAAAATTTTTNIQGINDKDSNDNNNNINNNNNNNSGHHSANTPNTPLVNFYTINELQKFAS